MPIDLVPQLRRHRNDLATIDLVEPNLDLGPELLASLVLFEQTQGLVDNLAGVLILAGGNQPLYQLLVLTGKRDGQVESPLVCKRDRSR